MMIHNIIFHNVSRMPDKILHNLEINLMSCIIKYFIFLKFKNTFHTTIFLTEMKKMFPYYGLGYFMHLLL